MIEPNLLILGEYSPDFPPHRATDAAIQHSLALTGSKLHARWVSTVIADEGVLANSDGIWIAPGSPYRDLGRTLEAIRWAREMGVPCLGTCGGFQHMILEYARHFLGYTDAEHAEYDPEASRLFISKLACSLAGREMTLNLEAGSQVAGIYGEIQVREHYYCNFGVAPDAVPLLKTGPLRIVGSDAEGEARVVELPGHPFFVGTLFVPQSRSTADLPHPLINAFVRAVVQHHALGCRGEGRG